MRAEITSKVNQILIDEFELEPESIIATARLYEDLELDSLDAVDLIAALERHFERRVPEEAARAARTVADIYALIERLSVEGEGAA
ncbi:acyl carrier protein [Myxococcota bacterium]|nr:acyl carrier protein [Myxococcota bacterium]MBU1431530.1 acyl carrier protein [Myxococcota bacterium]MBU1899627.1 acyl carrier protein [Myxococcota bacterium]